MVYVCTPKENRKMMLLFIFATGMPDIVVLLHCSQAIINNSAIQQSHAIPSHILLNLFAHPDVLFQIRNGTVRSTGTEDTGDASAGSPSADPRRWGRNCCTTATARGTYPSDAQGTEKCEPFRACLFQIVFTLGSECEFQVSACALNGDMLLSGELIEKTDRLATTDTQCNATRKWLLRNHLYTDEGAYRPNGYESKRTSR